MNKTRKFMETLLIYFGGNVFIRVINFITLPLFTSVLSPADYGYFDLICASVSILTPLIFFDISTGLLRFMCEYADIRDKYKVVSNVCMLVMFLAIIYTIVFVIVNIVAEIKYLFWIYLFGLSGILQNIVLAMTRGFGKNKIYIISGIINSGIVLMLNILFVLYYKLGIVSLLISGVVANIIQVLFIAIYVNPFQIMVFNNKTRDSKLIMQIMKFCFPLVINACSFWVLTNASRIVVASLTDISSNGYIAIADKFASLIVIFTSIFSLVWQETAYMLYNDKMKAIHYENMLNNYIKILGVALCILVPATYLIFPYMIDPVFNRALFLIPPYFFVTVLTALSGFFSNIFNAEKENHNLYISNLVSGIINLCLLYLLIPQYGIISYVWSLLASYIVNVGLRYYAFRKRIFVISLNFKPVVLFCIFFIVEYFLCSYGDWDLIVSLLLISVGVSVYVLKELFKKIICSFAT